MYSYLYSPTALKNFGNAIDWYNERSEIAAENFIKEVKLKIKLICTSPKKYVNHYKNFRETTLRKYPFTIIYLIEEATKTIIIAKLFHHRRNPKSKYRHQGKKNL